MLIKDEKSNKDRVSDGSKQHKERNFKPKDLKEKSHRKHSEHTSAKEKRVFGGSHGAHDPEHKEKKRRTHAVKGEKQKPKKELALTKLELLITVVDRRKGEFYADLIQSFEVNMQMMCFGRGTAKAEMLRYLGFADSEKTVIFSAVKADKTDDILAALSEKFESVKNGKGIAFTVPMSSIIGVAVYGFLSNNRSTVKEEV